MKTLRLEIAALALVLVSCAPALPEVSEVTTDGRDTTITFPSAALARGSLPNRPEGVLVVHLPASYATSNRRYPVVYTLHGYGGRVEEMITNVAPVAEAEGVTEYLMVGVYGSNTFYADSKLNGDGARMVAEEAVGLVDSRFRTVPEAGARVIAGFSMGGYGAWSLALARPEVFGACWAVCPGAFDGTGLQDALTTWDRAFFSDYAAAFAPDRWNEDSRSAEVPLFDGSQADKAYIAALERGFGGLEDKVKAYQARGTALKAVRFDFGTLDGYEWIPRGTEHVAAVLKQAGLPASIEGRTAGHQISDAMVRDGFVPLVRQVFAPY